MHRYCAPRVDDILTEEFECTHTRFTVPVLWDKKTETIVNNESSEIIRMFNSAFNDQLPSDKADIDLYPEHLRKDIDELNEWVYDTVNSTYLHYRTRTSTDPHGAY